MQMKKKKVLVVSLIVAMIAILSLGTLAWFTDSDEVTNTFNFGNGDFSIDVYETDENGTTIVNAAGETVGQTYDDIMPGDELHKDPTVWNDGTHEEWVRVKVILDDGLTWMNIMAENGYEKVDLAKIFSGYADSAWTCETHAQMSPDIFSGDRSLTWVFYLNAPLAPDAKATLFTGVQIPTSLTSEQAASLNGQFTIKVEAEAIQTENLPETVTTAQAAFALIDGE